MNKWRDFSAIYADAQLSFIAASDLLILFFMEVTTLCKEAMRINLFGQFESTERVQAFIESSIRCITQPFVPRTILRHKAKLSLQTPGYDSSSWCLNKLKHTRLAIASPIEDTSLAAESVQTGIQRAWNSARRWQLLQDDTQLQLEMSIERL